MSGEGCSRSGWFNSKWKTIHKKPTYLTQLQKVQLDSNCVRSYYILSIILRNQKTVDLRRSRAAANLRYLVQCILAIWNFSNCCNYFFTVVFASIPSQEFAGKQCTHICITIIIGFERTVLKTLYSCFINFELARQKLMVPHSKTSQPSISSPPPSGPFWRFRRP